jgi:hypothetical protein
MPTLVRPFDQRNHSQNQTQKHANDRDNPATNASPGVLITESEEYSEIADSACGHCSGRMLIHKPSGEIFCGPCEGSDSDVFEEGATCNACGETFMREQMLDERDAQDECGCRSLEERAGDYL